MMYANLPARRHRSLINGKETEIILGKFNDSNVSKHNKGEFFHSTYRTLGTKSSEKKICTFTNIPNSFMKNGKGRWV